MREMRSNKEGAACHAAFELAPVVLSEGNAQSQVLTENKLTQIRPLLCMARISLTPTLAPPAAGGCCFLPLSRPLGPELSSISPLSMACGGGPCAHLPLELVSH